MVQFRHLMKFGLSNLLTQSRATNLASGTYFVMVQNVPLSVIVPQLFGGQICIAINDKIEILYLKCDLDIGKEIEHFCCMQLAYIYHALPNLYFKYLFLVDVFNKRRKKVFRLLLKTPTKNRYFSRNARIVPFSRKLLRLETGVRWQTNQP